MVFPCVDVLAQHEHARLDGVSDLHRVNRVRTNVGDSGLAGLQTAEAHTLAWLIVEGLALAAFLVLFLVLTAL